METDLANRLQGAMLAFRQYQSTWPSASEARRGYLILTLNLPEALNTVPR